MTLIRMAGNHPEYAFWLMTPNESACEIASILGFGTAPLGDLFARLDDTAAIAAAERHAVQYRLQVDGSRNRCGAELAGR